MYNPTVADRVLGSAALRRRQALARAIAHSVGTVRITGLDNVPDRGPVVLAMNHRSFSDGPMVFGFVQRPVTCLVKVEAFTPALGPLLRSAGQIPVHRDRADVAAVRLCLRVLRGGGVVGIFPEGSRGDGAVRTAKAGAAYLAMRSGAPVVPVAFHGTDQIGHSVHRADVHVAFGEPIIVPAVEPHVRLNRRVVAAEGERIRVELAAHVAGTRPTGPTDRSVAA